MMVIVLLISAVISVTLSLVKGHYEDLFEGGIIFAIVIINAIIGVIQEKRPKTVWRFWRKKRVRIPKSFAIKSGRLLTQKRLWLATLLS